jgi:hypothetical protein
MDTLLDGAGPDVADELTHQAADEAMVALLAKLHTFKGRSRFTTWAYKFGILQASTAVRRHAWRTRQVVLDDGAVTVDLGPSVEEYAETADLARERRGAIADRDLARGPARLTMALGLGRPEDGADLLGAGPVRLRPVRGGRSVSQGPRVGVSRAAARPWRFWLTDDKTVSAYRRSPRADDNELA